MNAETAQAWVNMVELTDILQGLSFDSAHQLAIFIAGLWNEQIVQKFSVETTSARIIVEEDSREVFVTIGRFSAHEEASE